jgi:hypothetical protein
MLMPSQKLGGWLNKNSVLQGLVVFSGAKAYIRYVEVLKKRRNAVGRTFWDAINIVQMTDIAMSWSFHPRT